jgi:hypothetical protein
MEWIESEAPQSCQLNHARINTFNSPSGEVEMAGNMKAETEMQMENLIKMQILNEPIISMLFFSCGGYKAPCVLDGTDYPQRLQ